MIPDYVDKNSLLVEPYGRKLLVVESNLKEALFWTICNTNIPIDKYEACLISSSTCLKA
jgi:hypothetical protein